MKITALLPDQLVKDVQKLSNGKNLTESITIALNEWTSLEKLKQLNKKLKQHPLKFVDGFSAQMVRKINRKF